MEGNKNNNSKNKGQIKEKLMPIIGMVVTLLIILILCLGYGKKLFVKTKNPIATIEVEKYGTIKVELYPEKAPNTVKNFVKLANNGFYDGLKFHRVVKDFMIQGGDSEGTGAGSAKLSFLNESKRDAKNEENKEESKEENKTAANETANETENTTSIDENSEEEKEDKSYTIKGEFRANKFDQNDLNLTEGVIAMARADYTQYSSTLATESYNSAGTQFFIMTTNTHTSLSGYYAGFGKVIEGMDVVKKIADVKVEAKKSEDGGEADANAEVSTPKKDVIIKSITVDTFGTDYGMPETLEPFNYMNWLYSQYGISN